ncbi:MAG: hypothetical protein L0Y73_04105 [Candidatus Aminicenantes bacterium]|nr:hypothetical protein [Candidatus Aminicenantes bacterium]
MKNKMKSMIRPLVLLFLVIVFCIALIVPVSAGWDYSTGSIGACSFGWGCWCPPIVWADCHCVLMK